MLTELKNASEEIGLEMNIYKIKIMTGCAHKIILYTQKQEKVNEYTYNWDKQSLSARRTKRRS